MNEKPMTIVDPLVLMFHDDTGTKVICHIHPPPGTDYRGFGLLICDLTRHVAKAFGVEEDEVWEWVEKERRNPTTNLTRVS